MTPYYQEPGMTIYHGDARQICKHIEPQPESVITDPVWPNNVFPEIENPQALLNDALFPLWDVKRVVIHLGCDSDPRFLSAVPVRWPFLRFCSLEHVLCGYKGRLLMTGDIAYVFGEPPKSEEGARVLPGKTVATGRGRFYARGTGRNNNNPLLPEDYSKAPHPCARDLQHVRWLVKWFAGQSVLDPFMGSGTTAVACKELGIPFIGVEIHREFCDLAITRLSQGVLSLEAATA